ncbi:hypothetical protein E2C01_096361 [Portunus trituberculatus]|uniref:Uncharacterized protein n=1 Tax=Portunus trituberculatus TaxID=210409 RepID=A0A5B7K2T1_PORTR|nr:hypothetical protein [Portunus trituberculatus]
MAWRKKSNVSGNCATHGKDVRWLRRWRRCRRQWERRMTNEKISNSHEGNGSSVPDKTAVVQWNHACSGVRGVSKHTGSNPVHGPSVGWAPSPGATVS